MTIEPEVTVTNEPPDLVWLNAWLQPQHLTIEAIRSYKQTFGRNHTNPIVLKNFLHERLAASLSDFVNYEAELDTVFGLYSAMQNSPEFNPTVSAAEWTKADEKDRFFKLQKFVRLTSGKKLTPNFAAYLSFLSAFKNPKFRRFFELITGLSLDANNETFDFFKYNSGDFLRQHTDRGKDYQLAFILYLSPMWERRFGGLLSIVLPDQTTLEIEPEYNSLIIFNVDAQMEHFVSKINDCAGDRGRSTLSGWLHKPASVQ